MKAKEYLKIESAADLSWSEVGRLGSAILFVVAVMIYTGASFAHVENLHLLIAAAVIGAYMAMNIGANDVANNVGPAVGSYALTLTGAIIIASIFEAGGAIIAGGDVVSTVKKGIIDPANVDDPDVFVWVMMGALIGAALWLNAATWLGAPVSTTHSIVGGVMGAGMVGGVAGIRWTQVVTAKSHLSEPSKSKLAKLSGLLRNQFRLYMPRRYPIRRAFREPELRCSEDRL